jgi:hypothetical protein
MIPPIVKDTSENVKGFFYWIEKELENGIKCGR